MATLLKLFFLFGLLISTVGCSAINGVASLGVSSDGQYIITAHGRDELVLWDVAKKEKKLLAKNANPYSAYFIPDSHEFMWQDTNNVVHIQDVNGQEIKQFSHFETEGHIITADKSFYLSADTWGKLYKGYGDNLVPVYTDEPIAPSQPYTLSIHGNYILSTYNTITGRNDPPAETNLTANPVNPDIHKKSSYAGVTLWDKTTLKPIARLWGNSGRTTGRISPDGKWVVAGSDNRGKFMWEIKNPTNRIGLSDIEGKYNVSLGGFDTSKLIPIPDKFGDKQITLTNTSAVAFVSEEDFILFPQNNKNELALLFTVGDPWIKAYVEIGRNPPISTGNLSIASSPKAHILVTGQGGKGGINVYRYHPATKELEKIWVAD
ncbi:MAG: WD40 repeat domain-containing protein [Aggregatibacter aphrophilus]|jgi:WD-40 repeat, putative|uniref:WD40 repeat domain-containing protein n=1 Tax=Aggregatibacter aphrophilus TaxID=732 RepID=UPI002909AA23|nr:WD40 repeat domain-containing protein [Aggregatibacter aphrophilus]MDU7784769.1 WD40 repeat domain-containing protein [Aggregatibacter aphrophilus]